MKRQKEYSLKSLTSYKSAFSLLQGILISIVIFFSLLIIYIVYSYDKKIDALQRSIYIMDSNGEVYVANRTNQTPETRLYEYRDHVKKFFKLWYQLDPASYDENINAALKLIGKSGKILYTQYLDAGVKKNLITNGIVTKAYVDSIKFDTKTIPVRGVVFGRQKIIRKNSTIERRLVCTFTITDINRSKDNSHGALIDDWNVVNNEIIKKK